MESHRIVFKSRIKKEEHLLRDLLMSQRTPKGIKKLENVVNQPKLGAFVEEKRQRSSSTDSKGKRRRKSTGDQEQSSQKPTKKVPTTSSPTNVNDIQNNQVMITPTQPSNMLQEIINMEARLKASMKENRKRELDEMEDRMKNNMKSVVDSSINEALKHIGVTVSTLIAADPIVKTHTTNLAKLESENKKLNRTVQILAAEQCKLKEKINQIEKRGLEHCIIIRGIQEQYKETDAMLREKVFAEISFTVLGSNYNEKVELAKKMSIRTCRRLGRYNRTRARPISCEFVQKEDVAYIMENRGYLRKGIFADYEYTAEVERKRRILLPILRTARRIPEYRGNCRLEMDELVINGRHFRVNTLSQLPENLNPFKITTEEDIDSIGFFGAINPLSNFYECNFTVGDESYISTEQFIQATKARYFRDQQSCDRIMVCTNSLDCKNEGGYVRNYNRGKWDEVAKEKCRPGIRAKFQQNPDIMAVLIGKTGNKTIVESARDHLWGTGMALSDPDCLNTTKWTTQGILGELLEEIRDDYYSINPTMAENSHPKIHSYSSSTLLPVSQPTSTAPPTPVQNNLHAHELENVGEASSIALDPRPEDPIPTQPPIVSDNPIPTDSNLRDVTSSVSSMEISEPVSEPISDTTADSVRSDPSENEAVHTPLEALIATPIAVGTSTVTGQIEQNQGASMLEASCM